MASSLFMPLSPFLIRSFLSKITRFGLPSRTENASFKASLALSFKASKIFSLIDVILRQNILHFLIVLRKYYGATRGAPPWRIEEANPKRSNLLSDYTAQLLDSQQPLPLIQKRHGRAHFEQIIENTLPVARSAAC